MSVNSSGVTTTPSEQAIGSNNRTSAAWNRALVLRLLRKHQTLSRRQISVMTGLRGSTLTYIVRELLEKDLLREVGKSTSKSVGQKQVLLTINPSYGWTLGVSLRPGAAHMVLVDAAGARINSQRTTVSQTLDAIPDEIQQRLGEWLTDIGRPQGRMLAVGVGLPGVVDVASGTLLRSIPFQASGVPLQQIFTDRFGVPTMIDHNACYAASAEATVGAAQGESHFVYFLVNHDRQGDRVIFNSYGSALFLEGKVYRGAHFAAGELTSRLVTPIIETNIADLTTLATSDGPISDALAELATNIGRTLASIFDFLDLQRIVLGGTVMKNETFLARVRAEVEQAAVSVPGRVLHVVPSALGAEGIAWGGAIVSADATILPSRSETTSETSSHVSVRRY